MTKGELLAQIQEGHRPFREAVGGLDEDRMQQRTKAGWTVKEMVAHVAFWEETVVAGIRIFRGETVGDWYGGAGLAPSDPRPLVGDPWPLTDEHNAREAAWGRGKSADDVLARWDQTHERVVALVASLSEAEVGIDRYLKKIKAETCGHYPEHLAEIEGLGEAAGGIL